MEYPHSVFMFKVKVSHMISSSTGDLSLFMLRNTYFYKISFFDKVQNNVMGWEKRECKGIKDTKKD